MKTGIFTPIFRTLLMGAMSLLFNNANAQTTITPGTPSSMIEGFTTVYKVTIKTGDTVKVWWEYSADAAFSAPDTLTSKTWTKDSAFVRDTFTVSKDSIYPVGSITGYTLYLRLAMQIQGWAITYGTPIQTVAVYPKPLNTKIQSFGITPLSGGGVVSFFGSTGSNYEIDTVTFRYRYGSTDIWRKPNPHSTTFVGMNQNFSRNLLGMLSNKSVDLWVKVNNSISSWDTIVTFTTTPSSNKALVAEAVGKVATSDSVFLNIDATSFNLNSKFYVINTVNNDTIVKSVTSPKIELLNYGFKVLPNTTYTFKCYGVNSVGTGNVINITITTQPKLVTPTFWGKTPYVRWDETNQTYYVLPVIDWVTNSLDKIKRIDIRIYTDSLHQSVPMVHKMSDGQSGLTGPFTGPRIDSDSGRFWYEYVVETEKSIYTSSLFGYDVNWKLVPKQTTTGIKTAFLPNGPVQCKLYNMSGQLVSESYTVNPKVNLFTQELPKGQLIAVAEGFTPFRIFNQGGM